MEGVDRAKRNEKSNGHAPKSVVLTDIQEFFGFLEHVNECFTLHA